jgi:multidrug efflux pump subunit AcrB
MSARERVVAAMHEIRVPLVMSTLTIVLAFLPLAFITGMMGPYMAPMAFNVPVSVISSTLVAFLVTPWMASRLLREPATADDGAVPARGVYARIMAPFLDTRAHAKRLLWLVAVLFVFAALLPALRWVPLKLLPFDNKNEVQVLIDMPEDASLERTAALSREIATEVMRLPESRPWRRLSASRRRSTSTAWCAATISARGRTSRTCAWCWQKNCSASTSRTRSCCACGSFLRRTAPLASASRSSRCRRGRRC